MRIAYRALIELDVPNACVTHTREISEQLAALGDEVTVILPRLLRMQAWRGVPPLLVGHGMQWPGIRDRISSLGVAQQVKMPGARPYEEMPTYFQAADIAVLPVIAATIRRRNGAFAMAEALRDLLRDSGKRAALGAAGRAYVLQHRTWRRAAMETVDFIERRLTETV